MSEEEMQEIIDGYTDALISAKHIVGKESELPYQKAKISEVLLQAYKDTEDAEEKEILEEAYMKLESFLSDEDFEMVSKYLTLLGELGETETSQEKIFEMAVEKVPTTAREVIDIFGKIEEKLKKRREDLGQA
jgi:vacuolar-type H+-ATPase catalytic subunit A/Vma1